MSIRSIPAGLISKGFQRIVVLSTAGGLNSTCSPGTAFEISVETQNVRMTFDGSTTPTANTGVLFVTGNSPYYLEGVTGANVKIARVTAGAIVQVQSWGRAGDNRSSSS